MSKPGIISTNFLSKLIGSDIVIKFISEKEPESPLPLISFDEFTLILKGHDDIPVMHFKHAIEYVHQA